MINARLAAEKGIYDTQQLIAQQLSSGQNIAAILTRINNQNTQSPQNTSYYRTYSASYNAPLLTFISQGHHQDADSYLAARFNISTGLHPFTGGVVACDDISLSGSGSIDSYDPENFNPSSTGLPFRNNAPVKVLDGKGNNGVTLSGGTAIGGNVAINNGSLALGNGTINGDVTATANVSMSSATNILGNVTAGGNLKLETSTTIRDTAIISGNVEKLDWGSKLGSLTYGGSLGENHATISGSIYHAPTPPAAPSFPQEACDPLHINDEVTRLSSYSRQLGITASLLGDQGGDYTFTDSHVTGTGAINGRPVNITYNATQAPLFGNSQTMVYMFDNFNLHNSRMTITAGSHVVIYSKNGLTLGGGGTNINVQTGASLTIITDKGVELGSSATFTGAAKGSGDNNGKAPISIYSSSSDAVKLTGAFNGSYAAIYAPNANVDVGAGGEMYGAIRGKNITGSGAAKIHYDESLANITQGNATNTARLLSVFDYYPN